MSTTTLSPLPQPEKATGVTDPSVAEREDIISESGVVAKQRESGNYNNGKGDRYRVDSLDQEDDPKHYPATRKWVAVLVIAASSVCATCASSIASFAETGVEKSLHVSHEVSILAISLFVMGLGTGPLIVGPMSELWGRNPIYRSSYLLFFSFSFAVAFAPNIEVFLIFRFITGLCGAAFLSVAGGSVSDLFTNETVATPMAVYTASPFLGPVLGPLISGFINQNTTWRWTYRLIVIWSAVQCVMLFLFVPETYAPVLCKRKARRLRETTGDPNYYAPLERGEKNLFRAIMISCYKPFGDAFARIPHSTSSNVRAPELIIYERMVLLLDAWNSLILGILYLTFQAFPVIFRKHGFNEQEIGLSFLGIGVGMGLALLAQPWWNRLFARQAAAYKGSPPPELRLMPGMVGGVLAPVGLYWLAFTTYKSVHWIVPIIASAPFGAGSVYIFTSSWTYLVVLYRPWAASVMAGNSFMRSCFAAGFPLFAGQMYAKLGTVGSTALLAGLCTVAAPLPFVFYKLGPRLRAKSKFAQ